MSCTGARPLLVLTLGVSLVSFGVAVSIPAMALDCQHLQPVDGELGYRARGERCEGFFQSVVGAAQSVEVVSLLTAPLAFDTETTQALTVALPDPLPDPNEAYHVGAIALSIQTYYRMDAELNPGTTLTWPVGEVLAPAALGARDVGLYGWFDDAGDIVYLPLAIEGEAPGSNASLGLRATSELDSLMWRERGPEGPIGDWADLSDGPLYAGDVIALAVPKGAPGRVVLEIAAQQGATGSWLRDEIQLWRPYP